MTLSNKEALAFEILVVCVWNCLVGCLWWWWWWWWGWQGGDKCSSHSIATVQTLNNNLDTTMTFSPFKCWVTFTSRKYKQINLNVLRTSVSLPISWVRGPTRTHPVLINSSFSSHWKSFSSVCLKIISLLINKRVLRPTPLHKVPIAIFVKQLPCSYKRHSFDIKVGTFFSQV